MFVHRHGCQSLSTDLNQHVFDFTNTWYTHCMGPDLVTAPYGKHIELTFVFNSICNNDIYIYIMFFGGLMSRSSPLQPYPCNHTVLGALHWHHQAATHPIYFIMVPSPKAHSSSAWRQGQASLKNLTEGSGVGREKSHIKRMFLKYLKYGIVLWGPHLFVRFPLLTT